MQSIELTVEQQLQLKVLENHIQGLSQKQVQKLLLKAIQLSMLKDNIIKSYTRKRPAESLLEFHLKGQSIISGT
ncbi:MAG TPA: hypothetical protein V6D50_11165 [Chroococcales cyanobacterium]|jgi:hypothetical protein